MNNWPEESITSSLVDAVQAPSKRGRWVDCCMGPIWYLELRRHLPAALAAHDGHPLLLLDVTDVTDPALVVQALSQKRH